MNPTAQEWALRAAGVRLPSAMLIGGRPHDAAAHWALTSPRDGAELVVLPDADEADVDLAVRRARQAFDSGPWPTLAPKERKRVLHALADAVEAHREELALLVSLEMGKPVGDALLIELRTTVDTYRWYAEWADKLTGETPEVGPDALALVTREPVGVVGVVVPWNFPMTLAAWKIAPALAVGCTVVVKPSEQSPLSALRLAELATEAGLPDGVLNVVTGNGPRAGRALGRHPGVDTIAFTGSTEVGAAFLGYAAESNLKRVWLELGGKSPNIVLPDADLDLAASTAAWGVYFNQGQMCTAPSRLIVHRDVHGELLDRITARLASIRIGDPLDPATEMGPLVSAAHREHVESHIALAQAQGARLTFGGDRPDSLPGAYLRPAVFDDVEPGTALSREEVFGPVLAVHPIDNVEQAVAMANDSEYGLAAGVWTRDLATAHRVSRRLRAGTVWVNCYEEGGLSVPFGGYKRSGNGRDKSVHALEKYTELKTTWVQL
ncbi:aldehyde dehydrogenase [Lentzea sp. NBRC 105346]|uniref:aldehyde dehydrogenase n=1 Tax=Lentzea sp. NBRC 105346 TaxID=3032205 RepID=UPI0024A0126E|nr:aldehyde dehydrogenase [Lentzea sp. NBRC 105346]GLZ29277.1 aldehyde dehydrogenase [Lentzea sp. NBRC 105346]